MGDDKGYIRFDVPEAAQKARAAAVLSKEGGLVVKNFIATLEPVTGKEETTSILFHSNLSFFLVACSVICIPFFSGSFIEMVVFIFCGNYLACIVWKATYITVI